MKMFASSDAWSIAKQVINGRWFTVFASFILMSAAGTTYLFAVYSNDIKTTLGCDQKTLGTVAFFKGVGADVGIMSGIISEIAPPWVVLSIAAIMNLFGYLMIYLSITGYVGHPHLWLICLYIAVAGNAQVVCCRGGGRRGAATTPCFRRFANTGVLAPCVKNFPESRGVVLGLLKGFAGLCSAIFTQLYVAFYGNDSKSMVLLLAWLPTAIYVVFSYTIQIRKVVRQDNELKVFCYFLVISFLLAAFLMVIIIMEKRYLFTHVEYIASAVMVMFLLFLPLFVVIREELFLWKQTSANARLIQITTTTTTTTPPATTTTATATATTNSTTSMKFNLGNIITMLKPPKRGEDYSILQAIVNVDMVIIFFAYFCGMGGVLTAIDTMSQIGESLGYPSHSINIFISLTSILSYMGRVASGFISEILLSKYKFPRPLMLSIVLLLTCSGQLLIAFGIPGSLYAASLIIGFSLGAQMPLFLIIISELFGLKHFATLYNYASLASPLASYILNVRITGHLYDIQAAKQNRETMVCVGVECFKLSFLILTALDIAGALVLMILVWRTRDFYRGEIYAKFRETKEDSVENQESSNK
ncbi:putative MFS transporter superfamily [Dioscorea sansibarensis]